MCYGSGMIESPASLRRDAIRAIIRAKPTVNNLTLALVFGVSARTIENDISMMMDEGLVGPRIHRRGESAVGSVKRKRS